MKLREYSTMKDNLSTGMIELKKLFVRYNIKLNI